ncbi:MAG: hypothetical protein IJO00_02740 [Clostridia bacterium]|nr:hypothetical protein [Clostridia bacterium]
MYKDLFGKTRAKLGLHVHTSLSDGALSPEEAALVYKNAGYDAIAFTDHWVYGDEREINGLKILSGCEFHVGSKATDGVFHILSISTDRMPQLSVECSKNSPDNLKNAINVVKEIKKCGGIAVLAHPAWSLNTNEQILGLGDFDALEIYNAVSECGMSDRPYSGVISDMAATHGKIPLLFATDDTHYYNGDECRGYIMAEVESLDTEEIKSALFSGRFYATEGPEVHAYKTDEGTIRVKCSPANKIVFFSNAVWSLGRVIRGEGLTKAEYKITDNDKFVRVEITDCDGKRAWSNYII